MIERDKIKNGAKTGVKVLAGVAGVVGAGKDIRAVTDWTTAHNQLNAIDEATQDLGLASRDLAFQIPDKPNIRGVDFYKGSVRPNPDNAIGTAIHGRYKLIEARLVPEADRVKVIVSDIENERTDNPGSDFVTQRDDLIKLSTDLDQPVSQLNQVKKEQYSLATEGTAIALAIPAVWIGLKKWKERKKRKSDPDYEPKGLLHRLGKRFELPEKVKPEEPVKDHEKEPVSSS
ncbi:MAG TPA: hypothetical protein VNA13_04595 [Xanthomonadales bacterium]|nr:hypothetical protein [Xanthomonadales bacterium]